MEDDGYGLYEAVGHDETTETPEHGAKLLVWEDSAVEEQDREFNGGNGWIIEKFDGEDVLDA